jgi:hypothetical protein
MEEKFAVIATFFTSTSDKIVELTVESEDING